MTQNFPHEQLDFYGIAALEQPLPKRRQPLIFRPNLSPYSLGENTSACMYMKPEKVFIHASMPAPPEEQEPNGN